MIAFELTPLEAAVLEMLCAGEDPKLEVLRAQLAGVTVVGRELTGVGFFTQLQVPADAPTLDENVGPFGDVEAVLEGVEHGAGFLLWFRNGRMSQLEGYSYGEPWPKDAGRFSLRYRDHRQRDLSRL